MYKIVSNDLNKDYTYVGSTTDFTKRKSSHKCICTNEKSRFYNFKVYQMIRENGGWDEFEMIEIEKYPCNDKNECLARERYWKEQLKAKMNTYIPGIFNELGQKEYDKQPHIIENKKKYRAEHIEKIYTKYQCLCHGKYTYATKARHMKSPKHQKYLNHCLNNHDVLMEEIDTVLNDINDFIFESIGNIINNHNLKIENIDEYVVKLNDYLISLKNLKKEE
jgi:hypothetical protein